MLVMPMSLPWLNAQDNKLILQVKVKPSAKENKILLDSAGCLQINLQASPQEGKANKMLIQYLAKSLSITQKQITILQGATSRRKLIAINVSGAEQEKLIKYFMSQLV